MLLQHRLDIIYKLDIVDDMHDVCLSKRKYAEYQYNVVDHFTEQGSSRAMTKRHWEQIVHKNARIPVQFIYYQIISLEISHEN